MPHEVILADDASDDGSIEETQRRFPMVRVVRHVERQGASPTKAFGAKHAQGEILIFLDGHCLPERGAIGRLAEDVDLHNGKAIITPAIPALDTDRWINKPTQVGHGYVVNLRNFDCGWRSLDALLGVRAGRREFHESPALIGCALAVSRELYDELWGFDSHMFMWGVEDLDFGLKCWLMGHPILHDSAAVVGHRFRKSFDNYHVATEHVVANQVRMARKNFTQGVWSEWLDSCRQWHAGGLVDHPEGLWARAWQLSQEWWDSGEQERAYLMARRERDEFWYAQRFGLDWPRISGSGHRVESLMWMPSPEPCEVELRIEGVPDGDKVSVGGFVVRPPGETGPFPRRKITLSTPAEIGEATLTRSSTKVRVFTGATGGTEITFNGIDNKFDVGQGELPGELYVQGSEPSQSLRDVELKLTLMHHAEECSDRVKFTVVQVSFDPDPVRLGYLLRPRIRAWRVVHGTVLPHELAPDINLRRVGAGAERVEIRSRTNNSQTGTIALRTEGRDATPPEEPEGDTTIEALYGEEVCGRMQAIVVIPANIQQPYPQVAASQPSLAYNEAGHRQSKPPVINARRLPWVSLITVYGHNVTITVIDQFGDPLDDLYEDARVREKIEIKEGEWTEWTYIYQLLSPQGTYEDPVGVIMSLGLVNRNMNAAAVKAWKNGTYTPPYAPLGSGRFEQEIKVEIGGHEIGPGPGPGFADGSSAISGRSAVSTINPGRVQIIWPTP